MTTKSDDSADTKAQVTITVYGEKGKSEDLPLGNSDAGLQGEFAAGKTAEFPVSKMFMYINKLKVHKCYLSKRNL